MSRPVGARVGPGDVGRRVVLRRRLPGGRYADLLGELLAWDTAAGAARVLTRAGEVSVSLADVVAGKPVPPPPARRGRPHAAIGWRELEDVAADGWRPTELDWLGPRGSGWRLRAASGFTGRANSVLPLGDPGLPLAEAVDAVEGWYRDRTLAARFAVPWPLTAPRLDEPPHDGARDGELDAELRRRGYALDTPTLVLTAALREVAAASARAVRTGEVLPLEVSDTPDVGWLSVYHYRGQPLPAVATWLLVSAPAQAFVSVRDAGTTVAVGRGASSRGWTGVTAMEVTRSHRGRGLARQVLAAIAEWGLAQGDRSGYLQVAERNVAADALYRSAGYAPHHGYHYRVQDRVQDRVPDLVRG